MMAAPYNQTMPAPQRSGAVVASRDTPAAVVANTVTSGQTTAGSDTMAAGETVTVRISGMRFEPASITVKPGTTVTWIHESSMPHTVSSQSGGPSSSTLYNGQSFSHTFDTAGRYDYLCGLHPSMKGSVMVEDGALDS
jgi:plastocyanin